MKVRSFFHQDTYTFSYVIYDEKSKDAVIIDPVLDFDYASSTYDDYSTKELIEFIESNGLKIHFILETHVHADHMTSSQILKKKYPHAKLGISQHIVKVQETCKMIFNLESFKADGSQFDLLLKEGEVLIAGALSIECIETPGHTPACISYKIENSLFTGDSLFMPDFGTGRCDFPLGSAEVLYNSIFNKIYKLSDDIKVFVGHDYQPGGRELRHQTTIKESKEENIHIRENTTRDEFVKFRNSRDKLLKAPKLLLPSIQINMDAGHMPPLEENGFHYLKIPLNRKSTV